jgi:hypothetical protein
MNSKAELTIGAMLSLPIISPLLKRIVKSKEILDIDMHRN